MDEGLGDEAAGVDSVDGKYLRGKDVMRGSHGIETPNESQHHHGSSPAFAAVLEGKNREIDSVTQHPYRSPYCNEDDAGVMVEELTLRNYDGENIAIVGTSKSSEIVQTTKDQWQHLYQIGSRVSKGDSLLKDNGQSSSNAWGDVGETVFSELFSKKPPDDTQNYSVEHSPNHENKVVASSMSPPPGGIRTKILSNSGFSEYFVKKTLKVKGIVSKGPAREGFGAEIRRQTDPKAFSTGMVASDAPLSSGPKTAVSLASGAGFGLGPSINPVNGGVNLREWMKARHYESNKVERLYIFRQVVDFVDFSHSQGVALQDLRPSFFKLLPSNQVMYLGSTVHQDTALNPTDQENLFPENDRYKKRLVEQALHPAVSQMVKKKKFGENMNLDKRWSQFSSRSGFKAAIATDTGLGVLPQGSWDDVNVQHNLKRESKSEGNSSSPSGSNEVHLRSTCMSDPLEEKWYASPEELNGRGCTFSSNIYVLGVLLFELLASFDSERAHAAAMSDLHHRILPPNFLSENPTEAGFCLLLLHPEPSSRPSAREVLRSGVISGIVELYGDELSSSLTEDDAESEILLHFLLTLKEEKQKDASKLVEEIKCLLTDIEEVERRQPKQPLVLSGSPCKPLHSRGNRFQYGEHSNLELQSKKTSGANTEMRLMKNISQLESAYFSTRSSIKLSESAAPTCTSKELLEDREREYLTPKDEDRKKPMDHLGPFFSGFCKYARYSKFEVRGVLRNGDLHNSANVICSLGFDRDQEYFAAAGVSKKIKIYDFQALLDKAVDIHYPAIEMSNKSRLSCICWNSYIRNYLASTDYDGIVKLWDAGTGQEFSQYIEHNKRAWSVDFSQVDPTKLASGSDDCSVKLWNINERNSLCTIRSIANICCVQFSPHSSNLLAFGSSDYKTYCYDLRNVSNPWCVLDEHNKAVSFVRFLDSQTLISASTDNTLKLWDLNKMSSEDLSAASTLTLKGHTNEKNFVGLSVADGYIACGSETNEVYAYYRSLPMPITSHKFGSIDPTSGKETDDNNGQFVSSVCWKKNSDMLVAANSTGCIKVLQMV